VKHCWKDEAEHLKETQGKTDEWVESVLHGGTCLLEAGHDGEHVFVEDDDIKIQFKKAEEI